MELSASIPNIVVVDGFYASPLDVRTFALAQSYSFHPQDHKGQRTNERFLFPGIKERFEQLLGVRIANWEAYNYNGVFQICTAGEQIVYHSDVQQYAAVVFLTPDAPPNSGTNLYKSKATGLREVNEQTALARGMTLDQAMARTYTGKLLDPTAWEMVDSIGNVFNRCAIWNGRLLHAAANYFGDTPFNARLFQMFFFDADPAPAQTSPVLPGLSATFFAPEQPVSMVQMLRNTAPAVMDIIDPLLVEMAAEPNRPMTPQELLDKANELTARCKTLPGVERMQLLSLIARIHDALHHVVKSQLDSEGTPPDE